MTLQNTAFTTFIVQPARDCKLGPWSDWSTCGQTCGLDSIQERSRPIVHQAARGGQGCQPRLERRYCPLPPCHGAPTGMTKEERMRMRSEDDDEDTR